jgi:hypothetical protein
MAVILVSLPIASTDRLWRSRTLKFERNWCDLLQVNAEGFAREGRLSGIRGWERTNSIIPLYHTFSLRETVVGICNAIAPTHRLKDQRTDPPEIYFAPINAQSCGWGGRACMVRDWQRGWCWVRVMRIVRVVIGVTFSGK